MPRKPRDGSWGAGGDSVAERPELAIKIAVVANTWTSIEGHMAYALGAMIGADHRVALAILTKIQTATAKSQMIQAVGKAALDARLQPELENLLRSFNRLAPRRNKVIHGLWGISDAEPAGLLWLPPDAPNRISLGLMAAMTTGSATELIGDIQSEYELWEAADFDDLNADLAQLASEFISFAVKMQGLTIAKAGGLDAEKIISQMSKW